MRSILALVLFSSLFVYIILQFINNFIFNYLPVSDLFFGIAIISCVGLSIAQLFGSISIVRARPFNYLLIYSVNAFAFISAIFIFVQFLDFKLFGFFLALLLSSLCVILTSVLSNSFLLRNKTSLFSLYECKSALIFGVPLMFHSLALNLSLIGDRFIISAVSGLTQLGHYSVTVQLSVIGSFISSSLIKGLQPRIYSLSNPSKSNLFKIISMAFIYGSITLFISLVLLALLPYIISKFIGTFYVVPFPLTASLVIGSLLNSWYLFMSLILYFHEKTLYLSVVTASVSVVQLIICYSLVTSLGISGAAYSYFISNFLILAFVAVRASLLLKTEFKFSKLLS